MAFTMPVVACKKDSLYEVVDGFHRTTIAKTASDIKKSLHNYVPIVELNKNIEDRITSTVRHTIWLVGRIKLNYQQNLLRH